MEINETIEQKLDSLFLGDKKSPRFSTVKTSSLTDEERDYLYKKAAIGMAHLVYRNGKIEDFHADSCKDATIPNDVMKAINKDVCNKCYELISLCGAGDKYVSYMIVRSYMNGKLYGKDWNEPSLIPLQLSQIRNTIIEYEDEEDTEFGAELMYINKDTGTADMMVFVFADKANTIVEVYEIDDEYLEDGVTYDFDEFVNILSEHYEITSYSIEYRSDFDC